MTSRIIGTGSYVPQRAVTNDEVRQPFGLDSDAVYRLTGIRQRFWARQEEASSDLAEQAARRACESAGVSPSTVDAVLVSTTSPDMAFPSTACLIQGRLGIKGAAAFDLSASCSGFLYGLSMADRFLRSGQFRRCLVVAAEIKSKFLDCSDEATAMIFADGAGAALVEAEAAQGRGILGIRLFADGTKHGLIGIAAGGSRCPMTRGTLERGQHVLRMQGGALYRVAVRRLTEAVTDLLKEFGYTIPDVKHAIFHQANGRLLNAVARRVGLVPGQVYSVIERLGNASSASLPMALDAAHREGRVRPGDLVLLGTFGGGVTWAAGLLRW
ncbi:3-oxoacyl-ACP synthase III family protein [Candidatus Nitrospira bockiana]